MRTPIIVSQLNKDDPELNENIRENFRQLKILLKENPFLSGEFRHYEMVLPQAVTNAKFAHNFNFIPRDIIQTFLTEGVTLTWKYDHFDRTNLQFTASAACTVRFLAGRYENAGGQ